MSDDAVLDEIQPRADDTEAQKAIFADMRELFRTNMRDHKALHNVIDRLYASGKRHRVGADGWDDDAQALYARFGIPIGADRLDKHESWFWRQWVRLHVAPLLRYYDSSTHPHQISTAARACWATEFLCLIKRDTIRQPSEGINHPQLGQGAVARFINVPEAWRTQTEVLYDSTAAGVTKVPPPDLYPPPPDKAPVGTAEEGEAAGLAAVKKSAIEAANRNENPVPPKPPVMAPNGRPYSEAYRTGFERKAASNLKRLWDHKRGDIEGREDARGRAAEDVGNSKPPMAQQDIKPENFGRVGKSSSYNTGWLSVAPSQYTRTYAQLKAKAEEVARQREAEADRKRKAEEEARRKAEAAAAEAEKGRQAEEAARRNAERARRSAEAAAAEAERGRAAAEEAARRNAEEARKKTEAAAAEAEKRRIAEAAAAHAEKRREAEEAARRKAQEAHQATQRAAHKEAIRATARKQDERHRQKVKAEIVAAFVKANVPRNVAEAAFVLIQKNAVPHVQIIY